MAKRFLLSFVALLLCMKDVPASISLSTEYPTEYPTRKPTINPFVIVPTPNPTSITTAKPTLAKSPKPSTALPTKKPTNLPTNHDAPPTEPPTIQSGANEENKVQSTSAAISVNTFSNPHNVTFMVVTFMSILFGGVLCFVRSRLHLFVRKTHETVSYSLVSFKYFDCMITIPISIMTAVANAIQISALFIDSNSASSTTQDIDRAVAGAMIAVRLLVSLVSIYLIDSCVRRSLWKQFLLHEYLAIPGIWFFFIVIILVDPSQVRFLPFMKSPFSEHSGGYPNLNVFLICMSCTIASSMGIFILSAASMVFIPLSEVLVSTILSGLWFVIITTITLLRLSRPVDVDDMMDLSRPSNLAAGGMQSHPKGAYSNYPSRYDYSNYGGSADSQGVVLGSNALSKSAQRDEGGFEMRKSGTRVDEMMMTGSRAATQPIRSPTPPKRLNIGSVLDKIPDPIMSLEDAKVASYAHIVFEQKPEEAAAAAEGQGVEEEVVEARRSYVSSEKVQQRVPFSFDYSVRDEESAGEQRQQQQEQDWEQEEDEGPIQRFPFSSNVSFKHEGGLDFHKEGEP